MQAESQLKQAKALSVPDEMKGAQQSLLLALQFRRDGLAAIAEKIRTALGDEGEAANTAITQIAGQMQTFLASDVLYQTRVAPLIKHALDDAEIGGQKIASSRFLPGIEWLSEKTVAAELDQQLTGGTRKTGEIAPGTHGTGLESVTVGNTKLQPDAPNRLPASADTAFVVRFTNQGENDEFDVKVTRQRGGRRQADQGLADGRHRREGPDRRGDARAGPEAADRRRGDGQGDRRRRSPASRRRTTTPRRTTCCSPAG